MEAHVVAQSDSGPRGDPSVVKHKRDKYENFILLCPNHHTKVDADLETWTVDKLLEMKKRHEKEIAARGDQMTEFEGEVAAEAIDADSVIGAKVTAPTRFRAGSRITARGFRVRKVTGLIIGDDDND